jgi:tetratricopeptide (TPR) repeat protein
MPIHIFFCYAHEDEALLKKLKNHLQPLQRQGLIDTWHDRDISAGTEWKSQINQHLNTADIILLLISSDFMASDYCYDIEMKKALERHERKEAHVIPIILRPVYWQGVLGTLQTLPKNAIPVLNQNWHSPDDAFFDVAESIRQIIRELQSKEVLVKAKALYDEKRYKEAITDFTQAISLDPTFAMAYKERGNTYLNLTEYQKAIADFTQAISLDPTYTFAYVNRGMTYSNLHKYQKAIADFTQVISLNNPTYIVNAYNNRGNSYSALGEHQEAIADFTQAISLDPTYTFAYVNRGMTYSNLSEYQKAITDYDQALSIDPAHALAFYNRGMTYSALHEYQKAIADYDQALSLIPRYTEAFYARGMTYSALGEYQKAIADFTQAISHHSSGILELIYALALNNRGMTYSALGEYQKAIADFTWVISSTMNPIGIFMYGKVSYSITYTDYEQIIFLAYSKRGDAYSALSRYQEAIPDYTHAIRLTYSSSGSLLPYDLLSNDYSKRGNAYFNLQEYQKAIADYDQTLALNPDNADAAKWREKAIRQFKRQPKKRLPFSK